MFAGGKMQLVAHAQQKVLNIFQFSDVSRIDDAVFHQLVKIFCALASARDPARRVNVSESALPFLNVGLKQIYRPAKAGMACPTLLEFFSNKTADPFSDQPFLNGAFKFPDKARNRRKEIAYRAARF